MKNPKPYRFNRDQMLSLLWQFHGRGISTVDLHKALQCTQKNHAAMRKIMVAFCFSTTGKRIEKMKNKIKQARMLKQYYKRHKIGSIAMHSPIPKKWAHFVLINEPEFIAMAPKFKMYLLLSIISKALRKKITNIK